MPESQQSAPSTFIYINMESVSYVFEIFYFLEHTSLALGSVSR